MTTAALSERVSMGDAKQNIPKDPMSIKVGNATTAQATARPEMVHIT